MFPKIILTILIAFSFLFLSCEEKLETPITISIDKENDFLVFGSVFGECIGDCTEIFLLTESGLHSDANTVNGPVEESVFNEVEMQETDFQKAMELKPIPAVILDKQYSDSDLIDFIADFDYYLYGKVADKTFMLIFDDIAESADEELKMYFEEMKEVADALK